MWKYWFQKTPNHFPKTPTYSFQIRYVLSAFFFFPLCYLFLDHSLYFVSSTFFPSLLQSDTLVNRDGMALASSLRCCLLAAFFSPCCRTAACPSWPVFPVQWRAWWKYLLLASAGCTLSKAWGTSAPVSTVWMHLPFGQLSSPGAGDKQLGFGTGTCGMDTFEHLLGAAVSWVPTSAWSPSPQGILLWALSPKPRNPELSPAGPAGNCSVFPPIK